MTSVQRKNSDMVGLLSPDFQMRNESQFAVANIMSTMEMLPELRGLWTFSSIDESGNARDLSGQGRTLTNNGAAPRGVAGLVPYASFNGTTQYFSRADEAGLDITGPLTVGGWFSFDVLGDGACITKWTTAGSQRSYMLKLTAAGATPSFYISSTGADFPGATIASAGLIASQFVFMAGRFTPSTEIAVFANSLKATNAVGVPVSIFSGTAPLNIGAYESGISQLLDGNAALCFLCAAAHSDAVINNLFQQTRAAFGV